MTLDEISSSHVGGGEQEPPFDLETDLSLMRVMAQMGSPMTMMQILVNMTYHLGDNNPKDDELSKSEAEAFAAEHIVKKDAPIAATLGLSGGHLPLDSAAAVSRAIELVIQKCDTDGDGMVHRDHDFFT